MAKTGIRPALAASTDPTPVWKVARSRSSRLGLEAGGTRPMVRRNAVRSDVVVTRTGAAVRALAGTAVAAWLLAASGAGAATVSEVRVGTHDDGHTRIVVELDSMAGYRLQSPSAGGSPELIVDLDASSISRDVPSKSRVVKKVRVEPSGTDGSTVRISLATGDVAVKEMLLANPPRIVFDLKARGPIPKNTDVAEAAPVEPAKSEAEATPEEIAAISPPAPTPAKAEAPRSEPIVLVAPEPAEKSSALKERDAIPPASSPSKVTMPSAATPGLANDAMPPPPTSPQPELEPAPAASAATEPTPAPTPTPTLIPPIEREKRIASTPPPSTASPEARRETIAAKAQSQNEGGESLLDLALSPIGLGAIAAVVLLLAIVVLRRRRAAEDEDPLYTVMSADDAGAAVSMDDAYPATEVEARPPVLSSLGPYEPDAYEDASEPVFKPDAVGSQMTLGSVPVVEVAVPETPMLGPDDSEVDSIFASAPEPEVVVAPAAISIPVPEPTAPMAESPVAQISAEVERRVAELERRLEQLTEARERLERQVAAQTEELRVQRAAIARTQRVVRTIAKTEDMATEPVPRAPTA
jgi:hypothetical protein